MELKDKIMKRVQEHYDHLVAAGYDVVFTALQGSQNYGLDEYSDEYMSDVDTKSMVLPHLDDMIRARSPVSTTIVLENKEHAEVKDIRVMFEMFKKENISYIELLYSKYMVINPKYKAAVEELFERREEIALADSAQFVKCIAGMAYEKDKALCHPYPGITAKIEKYGYDGKQLSHCYRLSVFMFRFVGQVPLEDCYWVPEYERDEIMNYKKQLDCDGNILSVEKAKELSKEFIYQIKVLKEGYLNGRTFEINTRIWKFLDELKYQMIKDRIIEEVCADTITKFKKVCAEMVYPDENFKKAEAAAIKKMTVPLQANFLDYYKEEENEKNEN